MSETPNWSDLYTPEELAAAIDIHALKLAKLKGWYEIAGDLHAAAECIRDLSDRAETQRAAGAELVRQVLAARESLS